MERDHPNELKRGLERLAQEIDSGEEPNRPGLATMIAWERPGPVRGTPSE
jgi:hypothetical protein